MSARCVGILSVTTTALRSWLHLPSDWVIESVWSEQESDRVSIRVAGPGLPPCKRGNLIEHVGPLLNLSTGEIVALG